jgi:hypothetical protein
MRMITLMAVAVLAIPGWSQEPPKPGPEHKMLKQLEGNWDTTMKAGGMEFKGKITYKMELGGLWLAGAMESEMFGSKFHGKSMDSYSEAKKKYVSVWMDSMSTAPVIMEGTFDEKAKKMTMSGEGPGMDGKTTKYKSVSTMPDADTLEMTMYIGDGKDPTFIITYKRKK